MPAPNPDHLIDQAIALATPSQGGAPRQADIRRAISSAYYAAFHATLATVADLHVGAALRGSPRYTLAYRAVDHRTLRNLCDDLIKPTPPAKYRAYLPAGPLPGDILQYAAALSQLQETRHAADYDPSLRFRLSDAHAAIAAGRLAIRRLATAPADHMRVLLSLLVFPPRP